MTANISQEQLIEIATKAQENSYSPYSNFSVGAALITDKGNIFFGCNVENISFGLVCCAERVAIFKMISEKGIKEKIRSIAVTTKSNIPCAPCGACRQVIKEFSTPETEIIYMGETGYKSTTINHLLMDAFEEIG